MTTLEPFAPSMTATVPVGYRASGTSPPTVHLLGVGNVGRAFLRQLDAARYRLVAVTDATGTVHARDGLGALALAEHKHTGGRLADWPGAATIPTVLSIALVAADVVVDATATNVHDPAPALARCAAALGNHSALVLAAKDALCADTSRLAQQRVGYHAVLGGTGGALRRELATLRRARSVALVPNASTTALIERLERGVPWEAALAEAQQRGVLERDPTLDLDGSDAFVKLVIVAAILWGIAPRAGTLRADLRAVDPDLLRWRARVGRTTRLVARAHARGGCSLEYEEVDRCSPLWVPGDRVVYSYALDDGRVRVHTGFGIGPERTAAALWADVRGLCTNGGGR
jgi:homoserine dehydrogenase